MWKTLQFQKGQNHKKRLRNSRLQVIHGRLAVSLWFRRLYESVLQRDTNVGTGTLKRLPPDLNQWDSQGLINEGVFVH